MLASVCTRRAALRTLQSTSTSPAGWGRTAGISSTATTSASPTPSSEPILTNTTPLPTTSSPSSISSPNSGLEALTLSADPTAPTHYRIRLTRSAISLGAPKQGTLKALGFHKRFQVVYHRHGPEVAGKILAVKELVEVENVMEGQVRTREEMRVERRASRGYVKTKGRGRFAL